MSNVNAPELAAEAEDLGRLFRERASAGDVDGVVALYEPDAVLESPPGRVSTGVAAISRVYQALLADKPLFSGDVRPALHYGDVALTSTRFPGGATAEIGLCPRPTQRAAARSTSTIGPTSRVKVSVVNMPRVCSINAASSSAP